MTAGGEPPAPGGVRTFDELSARLRLLQAWAGASYREIHQRVLRSRQDRGIAEQPAVNTIYRCLSPGRTRLDVELVVDIARVLLDDEARAAEWRQAHQRVAGLAAEAAVVQVADSVEADSSAFVGRESVIEAVLTAEHAGRPVLIEGMPGVGKTALAVHLANHLLEGVELQLSVNLRGYDPQRPPADPAAVLDGFLRRLGMSGSHIHGLDLSARAAAFRDLLRGRRTVILLDNAASDDQLQPLFADGPDCLTLVTSRHRLSGVPGAFRVRLDVFEPVESVALLRRTAGAAVVDREPTAALRMAELVGHLPLALAVLASRINAKPDWPLADHLARLEDHQARLRLDDGVAAALSLSYEALPPAGGRMLRLLTVHPGRDIDSYSAAALAGVDPGEAQSTLAVLVQANLLEQRRPGRYELHDLVRLLASDQSQDKDPSSVRRSAVARLLAHYRSTVAAAAIAYFPQDEGRYKPMLDAAQPVPEFVDRDAGRAWFDAERHNLIATALSAAENGRPTYTTDLSFMMHYYLDRSARFSDGEVLHRAAILCADSDLTRGRSYNSLGTVYWRLGRYVDGRAAYQQSLELARLAGNRVGEASALTNAGSGHFRLGCYDEALDFKGQALALFRAEGNQLGATSALAGMGWSELRIGRYDAALNHFLEGLAISRELGEGTLEEVSALANVGAAYEALGQFDEALRTYELSGLRAREGSWVAGEGRALNGLGRLHLAAGDVEASLGCHREALDIALRQGTRPFAIEIRNDYGRALLRAGRLAEALEQHNAALADAEELEEPFELGRACAGAANVLAAQGKPDEALRSRALTLFTDLKVPEAASL